jgi:hypothetical protein
VLFNNLSDYARITKTIFDEDMHALYINKISNILSTKTEEERAHLERINPLWRSYKRESLDDMTETDQDSDDEELTMDMARLDPNQKWGDM